MTLATYREKRRFSDTPEPEGSSKKGHFKLKFVVQRHAATNLHYDFRLEMEGVLKSWAVPKGPSMDPNDKRLAMMVEDHPYEYRKFEGRIPDGNYGAGMVEIWDEGTYEAENITGKQNDERVLLAELSKGEIKFILHGEKLQGSFVLVKTDHMGENAWLLIKHKDEYAVQHYDAEAHVSPRSEVDKYLESKKNL